MQLFGWRLGAPATPSDDQIQGAFTTSYNSKMGLPVIMMRTHNLSFKVYWRLTDSNFHGKSVFVPAGLTRHTHCKT